jgi:flagellar biosynthesis protein FlhB
VADDSDDSQKTEDPTSKRLDDARNEGNVSRSQEINHFFMILALTLSMFVFAAPAARQITDLAMPFVESPDLIPMDFEHLIATIWRLFGQIMLAGLVPIVLALLAAFGASYFQFGLLWSAEQFMPKLDKISPLAGFKRIFSLRSVAEFVKGMVKITVVALIAGIFILPSMGELELLIGLDIAQLAAITATEVTKLLFGVLLTVAVIATLDVLYQRFEYIKGLRMSRQELKDEFKQTEGDPLIKNRLRQLRMERARRRMMADVPNADVVVTNPTHYAVALKYEQSAMAAPKVVAKGIDKVAQRIREVAEESGVPLVENPPLARGLYAAVQIDQEIPPEYYKTVAELISYIYKLKKRRL